MKQIPLIAGLTGPIGAGKSSAAAIFSELGAAIIDADVLAREAVADPAIVDRIRSTFGSTVINEPGGLDRRALGKIVFADRQKRRLLEQIIHPKVRELFRARLASLARSSSSKLILYVVPLLFEVGREHFAELQKVIVVTAPHELCIQRVMARDGANRDFAERKAAAQLPAADKVKQADFVINNDEGMDKLRKQVTEIYRAVTMADAGSGSR